MKVVNFRQITDLLRRKITAKIIHLLPFIFFVVTLLTGIFIYDDYGISWDEPVQRELGIANWNYVLHGDDSLFRMINKYHGPFIEMIEAAPEIAFNLRDERRIYLLRHLVNYFIFWLGSIFLFLLAREIFQDKWLALLTVLLLFLTPRIFAHSFYNSKDLPLLVFFVISFFFLIKFFRKPSLYFALLFGLVSAITFCIRIPGVIIPAIACLLFVFLIVKKRMEITSVKFLLIYLFSFSFFAIALYPVLWHDPLGELREAFKVMGRYPYDDPQLFMGKLIKPEDLPWYYIPVWIGITVPPLWQLFFAAGLLFITIDALRRGKDRSANSLISFMLLAWLLLPWLMVLILHSNVYDEWRHLFFIYPALLLIAVTGIQRTLQFLRLRFSKGVGTAVIIVLFAIQTYFIVDFMISAHPHENVYFNLLAGKNQEQSYDLDYWGLSYRHGLEFLVEHAEEDTLRVQWQNSPGFFNLIWLSENDKKRIHQVSYDSCNYLLTNFRFHPEWYDELPLQNWYSIEVDNNQILTVFRSRYQESIE